MERIRFMACVIMMGLLSGCSPSVELVGYGPAAPLQYGLEARLINNGKEGALLYVSNRTNDIISINQSPLAMTLQIRRNGQAVPPTGRIMIHMDTNPSADSFVIIAPGQTREISVPVSYEGDEYRAFDCVYRIEKGKLYDVEVQLNPDFGTFTKATSATTLSRFKIPNYLHETLRANTMTIRSR
jgi:hypothetical protein